MLDEWKAHLYAVNPSLSPTLVVTEGGVSHLDLDLVGL